jgi:hypothetical protein
MVQRPDRSSRRHVGLCDTLHVDIEMLLGVNIVVLVSWNVLSRRCWQCGCQVLTNIGYSFILTLCDAALTLMRSTSMFV